MGFVLIKENCASGDGMFTDGSDPRSGGDRRSYSGTNPIAAAHSEHRAIALLS